MWFEWFDYIHIASALRQGSPGPHSIVDLEALSPSAIHPSKQPSNQQDKKKKRLKKKKNTKELLSMKRETKK